jgi:hypothetical protein
VLHHGLPSPIDAHREMVHATAGQPFMARVARFSVAPETGLPALGAGTFVALIHWGDDTPPALGVVQSDGTGYAVLGGHVYDAPGLYRITVDIRDGEGKTAEIVSEAVVRPSQFPVGSLLQTGRHADGLDDVTETLSDWIADVEALDAFFMA